MFDQYINGQCVQGDSAPFDVINPATEELIATLNAASANQALLALQAAQKAFGVWSKLSIHERSAWILRLRDAILDKKERLTDLVACETGKTHPEAEGEVILLADNLSFQSEEAKRVYGSTLPDYNTPTGEVLHLVKHYPVGVTVGHIAWNYPLYGAGVKLAPSLASGCTCVLKPSSSTPLATLYLGTIAEKIGFPEGVFNIVSGSSSVVGKVLNESNIPRLIGVIGSSETGRQVMAQGATSIKRYSLELGGNAPLIVMPDASLEEAAAYIVNRKTQSCGQGCSNINRIYVHEDIHDKFVALLEEKIRKVKVGWGKEIGPAMGSLISKQRRDELLELIRDAIDKGARLLYGGQVPDGLSKGAFLMPTLLDHVPDNARMCRQEIFGPILPIYTFNQLDDVIRRANDTEYGLASLLYTHDSRVIARCSEELEFGLVFVNNPTFGGCNLPHFGIKESGVGCDCSRFSLKDYFWLRRTSIRA